MADDVHMAMVSAWQMPSFFHKLVEGPSCLTEPSVFKIVDLSRPNRNPEEEP